MKGQEVIAWSFRSDLTQAALNNLVPCLLSKVEVRNLINSFKIHLHCFVAFVLLIDLHAL